MRIQVTADIGRSNTHRLLEKYKNLGKKSLTVGIHKKDNKPYPNGATTAKVGFWHEFGVRDNDNDFRLVPRVWLRIFNLIEQEKSDLRQQVLLAFQNDDLDTALEEIGAYMKDRIRDRILSNEVVPHSHNKSGITLYDTGQLVNSIDYEVNDVQ